jgi:hypothetical protein
MYNVILRRVRAILSVLGCVYIVIQHTMRMRRIVICGLPYFPTLSHKRQDFQGGGGGNKD